MSDKKQMFMFLFEPTRWTFGVAWQYGKTEYMIFQNPMWFLEISIQIPVIALSISFTNEKEFYNQDDS